MENYSEQINTPPMINTPPPYNPYMYYIPQYNPYIYYPTHPTHPTHLTHPTPHPIPVENVQDTNLNYGQWDKISIIPEFIDPKDLVKLNLIKKSNKKDKRCYTCKPRGKVKKHIINTSESGKYYFHHDMHKRPVIIMTPVRHIQSIDELTSEELVDLFSSIKKFTTFWNIDEYQISFNAGKWQTHEHFHCKIRISEKIINRLRRDHFCKIKMEDRYE